MLIDSRYRSSKNPGVSNVMYAQGENLSEVQKLLNLGIAVFLPPRPQLLAIQFQ